MAFFIFVVINAILYLRPAELVPSLAGLPLYELAMICCLVLTVGPVVDQFSPARLAESPITVCILGLLIAIVVSQLAHQAVGAAASAGADFAKIVLYHLTLLAVITTPARLSRFLKALIWLIVGVAALPLLQEAGVVNFELQPTLQEFGYDPQRGAMFHISRMASIGLDPNDLAMLLAPIMLITLWRLDDRSLGIRRFWWLLPMAILGYVFYRTQSRGGMLCLLAGGFVLLHARIGTRKTIAAAVLAVPVLLIAGLGRMTDLSSIESGTGQSRVQLWSGALSMFKEDPLFGIGYGSFVERVGEAAHNSFVHCYAELGFLGGTFFMGAFGCAIWILARSSHPSSGSADDVELTSDQREMFHLRPFLLAAAVAYIVGMLSLSRAYVVPTYMILGLSTAWLRIVGRQLELPRFVFDLQFARHLATAGVVFLAATYGFIQFFLRW